LTTHARVLLCTRPRPQGLRLREIVATAGITGRSTHSIATDLAEAGYVPQARRRPDQPPPNPGLPAAARTPPARNLPSGSYPASSRARARTAPAAAVPPRPGPASEPPATTTSPPPLRADWRAVVSLRSWRDPIFKAKAQNAADCCVPNLSAHHRRATRALGGPIRLMASSVEVIPRDQGVGVVRARTRSRAARTCSPKVIASPVRSAPW
jgi:hypothetical protein